MVVKCGRKVLVVKYLLVKYWVVSGRKLVVSGRKLVVSGRKVVVSGRKVVVKWS